MTYEWQRLTEDNYPPDSTFLFLGYKRHGVYIGFWAYSQDEKTWFVDVPPGENEVPDFWMTIPSMPK